MRFVLAAVEVLSLLAGCVVACRYLLAREKCHEHKVVSLAFVAMFSAVAVALGGSSINYPMLAWTLRLAGAVEGANAIAAAAQRKSFLEQIDRAVTATVFFLLSMF